MEHINIKIEGRVQGVGFRYFAKAQAEKADITGWVRNTEDGGVYLEAEGDKQSLERFISALKQGPLHAVVENMSVTKGGLKSFTTFDIH